MPKRRATKRASSLGGLALAGALALGLVSALPARGEQPTKVNITGEIVDSWCYLSEIMWAQGTAHHRCAIWCARGGVPVSILAEDGELYVLLLVEDDPGVIGNEAIFRQQTDEVVVEGDLYERNGIKYLAINRILDDHGIVNYSHEEFDIQPGGL